MKIQQTTMKRLAPFDFKDGKTQERLSIVDNGLRELTETFEKNKEMVLFILNI